MGRTLPWNPAGHHHPATNPPTSLSLHPVPAPARKDGSASPPSSPPRPSEAPLPESFMVQGFDNDDRWRMVEDEFYSVASRFTAHLHAAQYRRLKHEAKKRLAAIHHLPRPVTRPPTLDVVRRQAASTLAASQRRAVAVAVASSHLRASGPAPAAEDTDRFQVHPPGQRTHLASLLDSPRKRLQPLTNIANSNPEPRAARTALGRHLTPERARSQSDRDGNVHGCDRYSPSSDPTQQARHSPDAAALAEPLQQLTSVGRPPRTADARPAGLNHDSDSGPETYFQRRLRARRAKSKPHRGHKRPTPDQPRANEPSQAGPESHDTSSAALSVPSI